MIHPIEYRYGSDDMRKIFHRDTWVKYAVDVEFALLESLVEAGIFDVDKETLKNAYKEARKIDYNLVKKFEEKYKHETFALVYAIYERVGGEVGRILHVGMTSNDVLDNVMMMQVRDALKLILGRLDEVVESLVDFINRYRSQVVVGRTHGRNAVPITLGFRFMLYLDELLRIRDELEYALKNYIVGKLGGAVGSQVELYPHGELVEKLMLQKLGLKRARAYLQILPRDLLAHIVLRLILLSSILGQVANEIRVLSRSGIDEVSEGFGESQVGSSVMPHKKNPILSEKVCGLSRYLRGLAPAILENIVFEDERDLRNSSLERTLIPEVFLILDEQLISMKRILSGLAVDVEQCMKNLKDAGFEIYSSVFLHIGVMKGGDRQKLHEKLRSLFSRRYSSLEELYEAVKSDAILSNYYTFDDLKRASDLGLYISACEAKIKRFMDELE